MAYSQFPFAHGAVCMLALALTLVVSSVTAGSVNASSLDEFSTEIFPGGEMVLAEDVNQAWTLEEAIGNLVDSGELWGSPGFPVLGFTSSAWWASLTIDNEFTEGLDQLSRCGRTFSWTVN